jgi:hypothetical protein
MSTRTDNVNQADTESDRDEVHSLRALYEDLPSYVLILCIVGFVICLNSCVCIACCLLSRRRHAKKTKKNVVLYGGSQSNSMQRRSRNASAAAYRRPRTSSSDAFRRSRNVSNAFYAGRAPAAHADGAPRSAAVHSPLFDRRNNDGNAHLRAQSAYADNGYKPLPAMPEHLPMMSTALNTYSTNQNSTMNGPAPAWNRMAPPPPPLLNATQKKRGWL